MPPSTRPAPGRRAGTSALLLILAATLLLLCSSPVSGAEGMAPLPSRAALASALNCAHTPRPTLVLFTPPLEGASRLTARITSAAAATLRRLSEEELLPAGLIAAAHTFEVASAEDRALFHLLAPGEDVRRPVLALYCAAVGDAPAGVVLPPGASAVSFPVFVPRFYLRSTVYRRRRERDSLAGRAPAPLSDAEGVREWVLSEAPVHFVDAVTAAPVQPTRNALTAEDLRRAVAEVAAWGGPEGGVGAVTATRRPAVVVAARAHLTTRGSEAVLAALNAAVARAGGDVVALVVESAGLAGLFGLSDFNTARVVLPRGGDIAAFAAAVEKGEGAALAAAASPVTSVNSTLEAGRFIAAAAADVPQLGAPISASQAVLLRSWREALRLHRGPSPLLKLTADDQLQRLMQRHSVRVIFFLRESDELFFPQYHQRAVELATRLRGNTVVVRRRLGGGNATVTLPFPTEVFWVDAEHHPSLASRLQQTAVPSVVVAVPIISNEAKAEVQRRVQEGRSIDGIVMDAQTGFHTFNAHDMRVPDPPSGGEAFTPPQRQSDLAAVFPPSADDILRLLADPHLFQRVTVALLPFDEAALTMGTPSSSTTTADAAGGAANHRYLRLDWRHYPSSIRPRPPATYIRDLVTGELGLPPYIDDGDDDAAPLRTGDGANPPAGADAVSARDRSAWQRQLEERRLARERRVREKAEADAARRAEASAALKSQAARAAAEEEEKRRKKKKSAGAERGAGAGGGGRVPAGVAFTVERPPAATERSAQAALEKRRRKAIRDATAWRDEDRRVASLHVTQRGSQMTLYPGLEPPPQG